MRKGVCHLSAITYYVAWRTKFHYETNRWIQPKLYSARRYNSKFSNSVFILTLNFKLQILFSLHFPSGNFPDIRNVKMLQSFLENILNCEVFRVQHISNEFKRQVYICLGNNILKKRETKINFCIFFSRLKKNFTEEHKVWNCSKNCK